MKTGFGKRVAFGLAGTIGAACLMIVGAFIATVVFAFEAAARKSR